MGTLAGDLAGKSTLMSALFRLLEAADGSISIDAAEAGDRSIAQVLAALRSSLLALVRCGAVECCGRVQIGLKELRRKLSIIPQDPVIFSGTVRISLHPTYDA